MIYVVTKGVYSDYHIEGCFSDKEKAERYAVSIGGEVETYEDGVKSDLVTWQVLMNVPNRDAAWAYCSSTGIYSEDSIYKDHLGKETFHASVQVPVGVPYDEAMERVIKVANERLTMELAKR